jgi:hypothetical protein
LGGSLLQDAVNRAVAVSHNAGVRALLVHALHDQAKMFYEHYGFQVSPVHPLTLMLRLHTIRPAASPDFFSEGRGLNTQADRKPM